MIFLAAIVLMAVTMLATVFAEGGVRNYEFNDFRNQSNDDQ